MGIVAAFMVPHPPLIIPEIGKDAVKTIEKTVKAYERAADEIAKLEPDTIVITSPHSVMYADCFHVSPGKEASGSFERFGASEVKFSEEYDTEFVSTLEESSNANPVVTTLGERDASLDHGTLVPLYFIRQKYKGGKIIRIGLSALPLEDHYKLGQLIKDVSDRLGRKVVFVASGDLSHKLQEYGPYGFAKEGPEYDERLMDVCKRGSLGELFDFDSRFCDKAAECGHRSFVIMAGALDGFDVKSEVFSHEDVTGVGYGICSFYPTEKKADREFLRIREAKKEKELAERKANEDAYVSLARKTIEAFVSERRLIDVPDNLPEEMLSKKAGAFVSIHEKGMLRGCIGTIASTTDFVAKEIIQNAISAASKDPRFDPVREDELKYLEISVDVLGDAEDIDSPEELDVKRYGVIVTSGFKRGLLLPDLDGVDTVEDQIAIAKSKAGITEEEDYKLQRFEVIRHH